MEERNEILKANILALFKLFDNATHVIVNYMISHNAFTQNFQDLIINNNKLTQLSKLEDPKPPFFHSQNEMHNYYNDLFVQPKHEPVEPKPVPFKNETECLQSQLIEALAKEDYLKAAHIRDYANEFKINLQA
jgi:hypothetical protein